MSNKELNETLVAIARSNTGDGFRRDTPMLLDALDRVQEINRELAQMIYDNDATDEDLDAVVADIRSRQK